MAVKKHQLAGRVSAATIPNMVSFCSCGLGFWGEDITGADARLTGHIDSVTSFRQTIGDLLARMLLARDHGSAVEMSALTGDAIGLLLKRERER